MTRAEYKTEPDKIAVKDLIRLFIEYFLPKKKHLSQPRRILLDKQTETEKLEDVWRRLTEIEKECAFEENTAEDLIISNIMTALKYTKLRDKLMKIKEARTEENNRNVQTENIQKKKSKITNQKL